MRTLECDVALLVLFIWSISNGVHGQLSSTFYDKSCPRAQSIVKAAVKEAVAKEKRMGASLLRLHFHDCFVNGCDGSILLDDSSSITGEKTAGPNANSARGFEVIDSIKTQLEETCSGVVSCADILAIVARDSVVELGGPTWTVMLGRRDSTTANLVDANNNIPSFTSNFSTLRSSFQSQGLSIKDMFALSGAHTIGQAQCSSFRARIYNASEISPSFAASVKINCPSTGGDNTLSPLDVATPTTFDNKYYSNLRDQEGLLQTDQQLVIGEATDSFVSTYSTDQNAFFEDFAAAMVNMGNIKPLPRDKGEIRRDCRKPN
eukprot:PITA_08806